MIEVKQVFGETLRKHRTSQRRTQQELSESANMSLRYYQELEAGTKQPSITMLFQLAISLELEPTVLLEPAYKLALKQTGKKS